MKEKVHKQMGRFIKKGSPILDKVVLNEFSFDDVSSLPIILPDNSRKSVIHHPYHDEDEIKNSITAFDGMEKDLIPAGEKRPILIPLDFSKEWERKNKLRTGQGNLKFDEDDEFDYELAMKEARETRQSAHKNQTSSDLERATPEVDIIENSSTDPGEESSDFKPNSFVIKKGPSEESEAQIKSSPDLFPSQMAHQGLNWNSIDVASNALKSLSNNAVDKKIINNTASEDQSNISQKSEFIAHKDIIKASESGSNPEIITANEYKKRLSERIFEQDEIRRQIEEEKAQGYRDGFKIGEEKGELQVRELSKEIRENVKKISNDFEIIQKNLMDNVQENFMIVCQALAEALIKREFSLDPKTFRVVVERAIQEGLEPGKVRVRVHPDTFDRLSLLQENDPRDYLVKDQNISPGDFKLESEMSVVDVNISKLITQLLSQADLNLFESVEKAG